MLDAVILSRLCSFTGMLSELHTGANHDGADWLGVRKQPLSVGLFTSLHRLQGFIFALCLSFSQLITAAVFLSREEDEIKAVEHDSVRNVPFFFFRPMPLCPTLR